MKNSTIITLTTDFGYRDPFVGVMKGVILKINPDAIVIDIAHDITPFSIIEAAFLVGMNYEYFPDNSIHIAVVDPAVGSGRRPILVISDKHFFVGPDNGIFSLVYKKKHEILDVIHLTSEHYFLPSRSSTFHGRDVFAPIAAWLTKGIDPAKFGDVINDYTTIQIPDVEVQNNARIVGQVIYIDRFGNAITNITSEDIASLYSNNPEGVLRVTAAGKPAPFRNYYSQTQDRGLYSLIDSMGYLELYVYKGSAAQAFGKRVGDKVEVSLMGQNIIQ